VSSVSPDSTVHQSQQQYSPQTPQVSVNIDYL
jgi:hypothetical protein